MFNLNTPIEQLYLVGPLRAKLLKKLEIHTLGDLLFYFPRTHQDLSKFIPIAEIKPNEFANIKARVLEVKTFRTKVRHLALTQALVEDDSGSLLCVWFNQPFLSKIIKPHETFFFSGKAALEKNKLQLSNPIYEQEKSEQVHTARLVPIYPLTTNLTQKQLRSIIKTYLDKVAIPDYLPADIKKAEQFLDENNAVYNFHFPKDYETLQRAAARLAFDEIFITQVRVQRFKKLRQLQSAPVIKSDSALQQKIAGLPFKLTESQKKALENIITDLGREYPANRLLEGDVGSGKTIVAALAMWLLAKNNLQAALLAPTEILANQHYQSLRQFFGSDGIEAVLLTASVDLKHEIKQAIENGEAKIIFGTHALLEESVKFKNLALTVIDEQHRFGVEQRSILKQTHHTHLLTMSATPIPRSLALTLYGDLDISILSELPSGRLPVKTKLISEGKRLQAYEFIKQEIGNGRQAFVICPLIDESDKLGVKAATAEYDNLKNNVFPHLKIGLLHGKLKSAEKETAMRKFMNNEIQILVTTSVIEVGVDVPNATITLIEGAERFGLAQLHQFRGRVGRSNYQSYCFLFTNDPNPAENRRLQAIVASNDGFALAEKDLQIRGSGELYGTAQSGYNFQIATLSDLPLVEKSRKYANEILDKDLSLSKYPLLKEKVDSAQLIHLE